MLLFGVLAVLLIGFMFPSPARKPQELQEDEIRPLFHRITDRTLPSVARDLRGIYGPGRDPHIFVQFSTDANGIDQILNSFGGHGVQVWKAGTAHPIYTGFDPFLSIDLWEEALSVQLFDPACLETATVLQSTQDPPMYNVVIDEETNTIYIEAMLP
jgi:hypothetical protein